MGFFVTPNVNNDRIKSLSATWNQVDTDVESNKDALNTTFLHSFDEDYSAWKLFAAANGDKWDPFTAWEVESQILVWEKKIQTWQQVVSEALQKKGITPVAPPVVRPPDVQPPGPGADITTVLKWGLVLVLAVVLLPPLVREFGSARR